MDKNEREAQRRQEDRALNSALIWVGAAIVLEFLLVMVNRHYINFMLTEQAINIAVAIQAALKALRWISLAGFVVGIVWTVRNLVTGKRTGRCGALSVAALVVLICTHVILTFSSTGLHMLFWLVPALAALALVFYLYQQEFFFSAWISGMGVLGRWFARYAGGTSWYVILLVVLIVLVAAAVVLLVKNGGCLPKALKERRVLPAEATFPLVLLSAVVSLVVIGLTIVMGDVLAYYLVYAMVAWLFALLVYYTVKMM